MIFPGLANISPVVNGLDIVDVLIRHECFILKDRLWTLLPLVAGHGLGTAPLLLGGRQHLKVRRNLADGFVNFL